VTEGVVVDVSTIVVDAGSLLTTGSTGGNVGAADVTTTGGVGAMVVGATVGAMVTSGVGGTVGTLVTSGDGGGGVTVGAMVTSGVGGTVGTLVTSGDGGITPGVVGATVVVLLLLWLVELWGAMFT